MGTSNTALSDPTYAAEPCRATRQHNSGHMLPAYLCSLMMGAGGYHGALRPGLKATKQRHESLTARLPCGLPTLCRYSNGRWSGLSTVLSALPVILLPANMLARYEPCCAATWKQQRGTQRPGGLQITQHVTCSILPHRCVHMTGFLQKPAAVKHAQQPSQVRPPVLALQPPRAPAPLLAVPSGRCQSCPAAP